MKLNYKHTDLKNKNFNLLGFSIYSKKYEVLTLEKKDKIFNIKNYSGLVCMKLKSNIEYKTLEFGQSLNWNQRTLDLIIFSFHNLFRANLIEIIKINKKVKWFNGLIKDKSYYFDICSNNQQSKDIFHNQLINITSKYQGISLIEAPLTKITRKIFNLYIKKNETASRFIHKILSSYSNQIPEISRDEKSKFLGAVSTIKIELTNEIREIINNEIKFIENDIKIMIEENPDYKLFIKSLSNCVISELESREFDGD